MTRSNRSGKPKPITAAARQVPTGLQRATPAAYNKTRTITASAERVNLATAALNRPFTAWQSEAWTGYERVGEIHYGFNLVANVLSRIRIYGAVVAGADQAPIEVTRASESDEAVDHLTPGQVAEVQRVVSELVGDAFASMVRSYSLNMSVPGECYLMQLEEPDPLDPKATVKTWGIYSTDEVQVRPTGPALVSMRGSNQTTRELPVDTYIARIWRQHPRYSKEPDSSMVAVADPIEELLMLQRLVRSATRSRLNAGLLFVPDGISVANATITPDPVTDEPDDPWTGEAPGAVADPGGQFLEQLMDSMTTPVTDEGSAAAVVPMVVTGPGELGSQITHKTFERSSDEWLVNRAERALERILQGIDVPKEVVTGLANVKYSNAVQISEDLYKANIEPLALVLSDSLTAVYLRPVLKANGWEDKDINRVVIWYDPSEIVTRPNAAQDASDGFDRYLISPDSWRRAHGFSDADAPSEEELALMLLETKGQLPPEVTTALLNVALPSILGQQRDEALDNSVVPFPSAARNILSPTGGAPQEAAQ